MQSLSTKIGLGILGGVVGLVAMELIKRATALLAKRAPERTGDPLTERSISPLGPQHVPDEGPSDAAGRVGYEKLASDAPSRATKTKLSTAVHIGYGLLVASLYNALRGGRSRPVLRAIGEGAVYGAGLWLLGDELVVPLLGLSDKPTAYPRIKHLQSLAQHLGFGIATAATANALTNHRRHWWS